MPETCVTKATPYLTPKLSPAFGFSLSPKISNFAGPSLTVDLKGKSPSRRKSKGKSRIPTRGRKTLREDEISLQANTYRPHKNGSISEKRNKKEVGNSAPQRSLVSGKAVFREYNNVFSSDDEKDTENDKNFFEWEDCLLDINGPSKHLFQRVDFESKLVSQRFFFIFIIRQAAAY